MLPSGIMDANTMAVATAGTKFAWHLFKKMPTKHDNIIFSPYSITVAMGMTLLGSKANTAAQMKNTMKFGDLGDEQIQKAFQELQESIKKLNNDDIKIHTANRLYGQEGYKFLDVFLDGTVKYYQAEFGKVNFQDTEVVRAEINKWVEEQTAAKIKNLITEGVLTQFTKLVLVNAIYFKGNWHHKFRKDSTRPADFHVSDSEIIKVDMMYQEKKFPFGYNKELGSYLIELPYVGKTLSMFILLPSDKNGLSALEEKLTADQLNDLEGTFRPRSVKCNVRLPKFTLESAFSLSDTLTDLGMKDLFVEGVADLSGIDGGRELFVAAVLHKAFMEVNEDGTVAAAATSVTMTDCVEHVEKFHCKHPFLVFIREKATKDILFLGKVYRPPQSEQ